MQKYWVHLKKLLNIAIPIVIAEAGAQLTHAVDTMMVGNVGSIYIAAASLANYLYLVPLLFGTGTTMVITTFVGDANGAGDLKGCKTIFSNAMYMQTVNGIILTVASLLFGLLIPLFDSNAEKIALSCSYYNYLALSSLPIVITFSLKCYLDGFGYTIFGMLAILVGNAVNVLFNWLLIYGNWGFPQMNLDGAGLATMISRVFMLIFIIATILVVPKTRRLVEFPKLKLVKKEKIKEFIKFGSHIGIQTSVEIAAFSLIVIFAGWLGIQSAAAYQITINISGLVYLSSMGIGAAATVLISNYKGAGNVKGIKEASRTIIGLVLSFTFVCTIVLLLGRNLFASLFVKEQDVAQLAGALVFIMALFQIPDGLNVTIAGMLRGLLDTKVPMIINSLAFWLLMIPLSYILAFVFDMGVVGIMAGVVSGIFICAVAIFIRFRYTMRRVVRENRFLY